MATRPRRDLFLLVAGPNLRCSSNVKYVSAGNAFSSSSSLRIITVDIILVLQHCPLWCTGVIALLMFSLFVNFIMHFSVYHNSSLRFNPKKYWFPLVPPWLLIHQFKHLKSLHLHSTSFLQSASSISVRTRNKKYSRITCDVLPTL